MHKSVLKEEAIELLNIKSDGIYIDATLGFAGHSSEILKRLESGMLLAFDKDETAIKYSGNKLKEISNNYKIFNESFANIKTRCEEENIKPDGILFDLGVSSPEIDNAARGFSYMHDGPLDMRMDLYSKVKAEDIVNDYSIDKLTNIFREYGEEKHALKIAKEIEEERTKKRITTTKELVEIIDRCYPYKEKRNTHPAKKVFQALRIEVNNEIEPLKNTIKNSIDALNPGGRLVVITFHSLEDRICKKIFKEVSKENEVVKGLPNVPDELLPSFKLITNKPIIPSQAELNENKRSKSAKLRVIEKTK